MILSEFFNLVVMSQLVNLKFDHHLAITTISDGTVFSKRLDTCVSREGIGNIVKIDGQKKSKLYTPVHKYTHTDTSMVTHIDIHIYIVLTMNKNTPQSFFKKPIFFKPLIY